MAAGKQYDAEYKVQAVRELGIPKNTLYGWTRKVRLGSLDLGVGSQSLEGALTLSQEVSALRKQVRTQEKEIQRFFSPPAVGSQQKTTDDVSGCKTDGGRIRGKISFYCKALGVSQQGFYQHLAEKERPWKYQTEDLYTKKLSRTVKSTVLDNFFL